LRADVAGECSGYSFGWSDGGTITMYEVGYHRGYSAASQATYLELLIYGPMAMSCDRGISVLDLGMFSDKPKRLRGATAEPVFHWVIP
jgi:hypothetical protein